MRAQPKLAEGGSAPAVCSHRHTQPTPAPCARRSRRLTRSRPLDALPAVRTRAASRVLLQHHASQATIAQARLAIRNQDLRKLGLPRYGGGTPTGTPAMNTTPATIDSTAPATLDTAAGVEAIARRMRERMTERDPLARVDARRSEETADTYRGDVTRFLDFAAGELGFELDGSADPVEALALLVRVAAEADPGNGGRFAIEDTAAGWRDAMVEAGLAPNTIGRRLTALRQALAALARIPDALPIAFRLDRFAVRGPKRANVRCTEGPTPATVARLLADIQRDETPRGRRDAFMLALLVVLGLRRFELASIRWGDLRELGDRIEVSFEAKARDTRQTANAPMGLWPLLDRWREAYVALAAEAGLSVDASSPVFAGIDRAGVLSAAPLNGRSIAKTLRARAKRAGIDGAALDRIRPHAFRHCSISIAAPKAGNTVALAAYSRHRNPAQTARYLDRADELAAELAGVVWRTIAGGAA